MVSRLDQFPAFLPFGVKDVLQPPRAALAGIMDKTVSRMVTFDDLIILFASWREFVKRNPIFPFRHILPLSSEIVKPDGIGKELPLSLAGRGKKKEIPCHLIIR